MAIPVIGLGAGGHAKVILEILRLKEDFEIVGLLDQNRDLKGHEILGVPVLGGDELLGQLFLSGIKNFFVGIGSISSMQRHKEVWEFAIRKGLQPIDVIHPNSLVSQSASIGKGVVLLASVIVNASTIIGENVILNTGAVVEHDCVIGSHVHIASRACVCGLVSVGEGSHIGAGSVIRQCIKIGNNVVVGAGSVVVKDIPANCIVMGNPAKSRV